ncbi:MAG TPA: hypothetical protein VFJ62_01925 [Usitatibacter sp.]|nr:hypothetical protein [Usitatibacter sp.]
MGKIALRSSLLALWCAGCTMAHAQSLLQCPPGDCLVDITVHITPDDKCIVTVFPTRLMVHKPSPMHFRVRTPGWRFATEKDVHFKEASEGGRAMPANLFTRRALESDRGRIVIHNAYDKDGSPPQEQIGEFPYSVTVVNQHGRSCFVDPVVVNN